MSINLDVRVSVSEVLAKIKEQREEHKKQHEEAMAGWRKKMEVAAKRVAESADKLKRFPKALTALANVPVHHLDDFDEAIAMLEMTKDTEIKLEPHEFNQLVRGKWAWKRQFFTSNSNYSGYTGSTGDTEHGLGAAVIDELSIDDAFEDDQDLD